MKIRSDFSAGGWITAARLLGWRYCLLLVWATWWGGLCFYALVVVPIGTDAIGSVGQGFITQRVTRWHNGLSCLFVAGLLLEAGRRKDKLLWTAAGLLAITTVALAAWHVHLTSMMDFQQKTVPERFYSEHAIYLWLTAVEWGAGLLLPLRLFATTSREPEVDRE